MEQNIYNIIRPKTFEEMFDYGDQLVPIKTMIKTNKLPHTILIVGDPGTGKTTLSELIAKSLNCKNKYPCGNCPACISTDDYIMRINAGDDRGIDAMREVVRQSSMKPLEWEYGITIIDEAGGMTKDAQRVLREITETPPEHRYIILVTSEKEKIQNDIRSRAHTIQLRTMYENEAAEFCKYVVKIIKERTDITETIDDITIQKILESSDRNQRQLITRIHSYLTTGTIGESDTDIPIDVIGLYNALVDGSKDWLGPNGIQSLLNRSKMQIAEMKSYICNLSSRSLMVTSDPKRISKSSKLLTIMLPDLSLTNQKADMNNRLFQSWLQLRNKKNDNT